MQLHSYQLFLKILPVICFVACTDFRNIGWAWGRARGHIPVPLRSPCRLKWDEGWRGHRKPKRETRTTSKAETGERQKKKRKTYGFGSLFTLQWKKRKRTPSSRARRTHVWHFKRVNEGYTVGRVHVHNEMYLDLASIAKRSLKLGCE